RQAIQATRNEVLLRPYGHAQDFAHRVLFVVLIAASENAASGTLNDACALQRLDVRIFGTDHGYRFFSLFDEIRGPFEEGTSVDASYRTSTVLALARQMYDSRDFTPMPILADALNRKSTRLNSSHRT